MIDYSNISVSKLADVKSVVFFFIKLLIAISLLVYLFSYVQITNIIASFSSAYLSFILLSLILLIPNIYLQYFKWKLTCEQLISEKRKKKVLLSLFYGFPAAVFTPARTGEYFGRGLAFKDKPFSEIILATVVDKIFTIFITIIFGSISAIIFIDKYYQGSVFISLPMIIGFIVLSIISITFILTDREWFYKLISPILKLKLLSKIADKLLILKNLNRDFVFKMISISTLFFFCYLLQFMILIAAFSHHFDVIYYFWAAVLVMFSKSLLSPISLSELGIREGAAVFFLTQFGESSSTALNASLTLFVINIIIPSLIGLFLLFVKNDD